VQTSSWAKLEGSFTHESRDRAAFIGHAQESRCMTRASLFSQAHKFNSHIIPSIQSSNCKDGLINIIFLQLFFAC